MESSGREPYPIIQYFRRNRNFSQTSCVVHNKGTKFLRDSARNCATRNGTTLRNLILLALFGWGYRFVQMRCAAPWDHCNAQVRTADFSFFFSSHGMGDESRQLHTTERMVCGVRNGGTTQPQPHRVSIIVCRQYTLADACHF